MAKTGRKKTDFDYVLGITINMNKEDHDQYEQKLNEIDEIRKSIGSRPMNRSRIVRKLIEKFNQDPSRVLNFLDYDDNN